MTTAIEYALMAGASYISNRPEINRIPAPDVWLEAINKRSLNNPSGFEATYFVGVNNEIVISFAGTDFNQVSLSPPSLGADFWYGNIPLVTGVSVNGADQLIDAVEYYLTVKAANPDATITLTGHSLGGALAALVGVFFGESAFTFDQVPAAQAAMHDYAVSVYNTLLAKNHTIEELAPLSAYITATDPLNTNPITEDTLAAREAFVTNLNVQGEVASLIPLAQRIGSEASIGNNHPGLDLFGADLHSIALLNAFLQSNQTAATVGGQVQSLSEATFKLQDLLKMIFDGKLFYHDPLNKDAPVENFLERLVKHEAGVQPDPVAGIEAITADAMVTRFTQDMWKLAQDGGMTLTDQNTSNADLHELSKALIAFAMQFYYENTANATNKDKQLFTDLSTAGTGSNGIEFDMHDVSVAAASAIDANRGINFTAKDKNGNYVIKGYQYFQYYLAQQNNSLSDAEKQIITSLLPTLRDWYIQAGSSGMNATDTLNRGAFMLGGSGSDALAGGAKADLLVGNAGNDILHGGGGNDILLGGKGNDIYLYANGGNNADGFDTILDSDGSNLIVVDADQLAGGDQYGDNRVHKDANGHLYVDAGQGNLIIDGGILIKNWQAGQLGLNMNGAAADVNPATTRDIHGDLAWDGSGDDLGNPDGAYTQNRDDILLDSAGNDHIMSYGGSDLIYADMGGDDLIETGTGRDKALGFGGKDVILGGADGDILWGGDDDDRIYADIQTSAAAAIAAGNIAGSGIDLQGDWLAGGNGDDTLVGSAANDTLSGSVGARFVLIERSKQEAANDAVGRIAA